MSEYIVGVSDELVEEFGAYIESKQATLFGFKLGDEIIRCADCVNYRKHRWFSFSLGVQLGTDISDVCMFFANGVKVEPDGYCKWAERKIDDE